MSGSNERSGFSFQLSETPPPARAKDEAPLGELDLDLQDFGGWEPSSPAEAEPTLNFAGGSPAPAPEVVQNATAVRQNAPVPVQNVPPSLKDSAVPEAASKAAASEAPQVKPAGAIKSPRIKKIQFPAKKAKKPTEASPASAATKQKTRFSESISAPAVASRLLDEGDSEPPPRLDDAAESNELALPDDLPRGELGRPLDDWNSETPDAKQIWRAARKTWSQGKRQALRLGGQGFRASRALAEGVGEKLRERMEAAQQEKEARVALEQASTEQAHVASGSVQSTPAVGEPSVAAPPHKAPASRGSRGLLLRLGKATAKKLVAPLSAAAAASLVYLGGTHFLGVEGGVGLNHMSQGAEIPNLGSLEEPIEGDADEGASGPGQVDRRATAAKASAGDDEESPDSGESAEMQVEIAPMPEGLSWPGKGLIEVVTSEEEVIYVDDVFTGRGPLRRIPVSPGEHEVSIRTGGSKRGGKVQVEINKNTRAVFKSE